MHVSTISKALKGDLKVAPGTRKRVRALARKMGFRPDPMLSALSNYRKQAGPTGKQSTIAWIYNYAKGTDMSMYPDHGHYVEGARQRCEELGYRLDEFWADGRRLTIKSLPRILTARGIRGVIFAPQEGVGIKVDFPLDAFCALTIGYSLVEPKMDIVTNDHFTTMTEILERVRSHGFKKIGCYLWKNDNERMGRRARSAFSAFSREYAATVKAYDQFNPKTFRSWVNRGRFDAIVARGREQGDLISELNTRQRNAIGFFGYAIGSAETQLSGMAHNNLQIGNQAAEWITRRLERGLLGSPPIAQRLLISGKWISNPPLADQSNRKSRKEGIACR